MRSIKGEAGVGDLLLTDKDALLLVNEEEEARGVIVYDPKSSVGRAARRGLARGVETRSMIIGLEEEEEAMGLEEEDWKWFEEGGRRGGLVVVSSSDDEEEEEECSLSVAGMISLSSFSFWARRSWILRRTWSEPFTFTNETFCGSSTTTLRDESTSTAAGLGGTEGEPVPFSSTT